MTQAEVVLGVSHDAVTSGSPSGEHHSTITGHPELAEEGTPSSGLGSVIADLYLL